MQINSAFSINAYRVKHVIAIKCYSKFQPDVKFVIAIELWPRLNSWQY